MTTLGNLEAQDYSARRVGPNRSSNGLGRFQKFVESAHRQTDDRRRRVPLQQLKREVAYRNSPRGFSAALAGPGLSIIAEFKRSSPTRGQIRPDADIANIVSGYERAGASAVSVLTHVEYFDGSFDDLPVARRSSTLPVLCKDFIVDEHQLYEAAVLGADAVLLVVAVLDEEDLKRMFEIARSIGLDCLVEVRNEWELERALALEADVIGINNRRLDEPEETIDLETTHRLFSSLPAGKTVVSESGIRTSADLRELESVGVNAVLIGGALMEAGDPESQLREFIQAVQVTQTQTL